LAIRRDRRRRPRWLCREQLFISADKLRSQQKNHLWTNSNLFPNLLDFQ
jgi:hypothetical protein